MGEPALRVFSIIPLSLADCRTDAAMVVFLSGCNMRCVYCQNYPAYLEGHPLGIDELVRMADENWAIGIVKFSGGEPTLQEEALARACERLVEIGKGIALDTNGTRPEVVERLARIGLREAAVDLKAPREKYPGITGVDAYDDVLRTIKVLADHGVDFEVRTTVVLPLIDEEDLERLASELRRLGARLWYLQAYRPVPHAPELRRPDARWLKEVARKLAEEHSLEIKVRL